MFLNHTISLGENNEKKERMNNIIQKKIKCKQRAPVLPLTLVMEQ